MASFNKVLLIGNLTRDPELRYMPSGAPVCKLGLAVNSSYTDKSGQRQEETLFMNVTVFGKSGENCASYLAKGRSVFVEGRLKSRSWDTEDGQKKTAVEVIATQVQFLGARGEGGPGGPARSGGPGRSAPGPASSGSQDMPDEVDPSVDYDTPF